MRIVRWPLLALLALTLGFTLAPDRLLAQHWALDRADSLLAAGDYQGARSAVDDWWSTRAGQDPAAAGGEAEARALFLRARLTADPTVAEADYLAISHRHSATRIAPAALLRLGQWLLAKGEPERAVGYLERLVNDYPGSEAREAGVVWLERAGGGELAGFAPEEPSAGATSPDQPAPEEAASDAGSGEAASLIGEPVGESPPGGELAIELGAFRNRGTAVAFSDRLERFGFDSRLALVPGSDRYRVRVGRYESRDSADREMARLQRAGFQGEVVEDATRERAADR